jgi:hypothetical protein
MSRRNTRTVEPSRGRDPRLALYGVVGLVVVLIATWVLFLPPFKVLRSGGGWQDQGDDLVRRLSEAPKPPEGFQLASPYFEIRSKQDKGASPAALTIPLGDGKGGRGLAMFTWDGGQWRRLASAEIAADGRSARAEVDRVPPNVVVMRRTTAGFQIQGILQPGAAPHPDAEKLLTMRSPADYVPMADGSLSGNPSAVGGSEVVALIPVIRATAGEEVQAVNTLLASEQVRAAHVTAITRLVLANRLDGVDLEYTALEPNLGGAFTSLVTALAEQLHKTGQTLTITLPLPRREANNWNTFGYDLKELGRVADYVRIPAERDQSLYRRSVRDALNFVTGQVDPKKVILTLSPLAAEKSEAGIRILTAQEALSIAAQINVRDRDKLAAGTDALVTADNLNREGSGAAGLIWDATAAAVSFVYQSENALRTVWIENSFSAAFKLELVQLWGLGGVAVDDASDALGMANIWPAIEQYQKAGAPILLQPNSSLLKPEWLVDGRRYEFAKAQFTWKAPELGDHTISLIVGDGVMRVINSTKVTVRQGGGPTPTAGPGRSPTPTPAGR